MKRVRAKRGCIKPHVPNPGVNVDRIAHGINKKIILLKEKYHQIHKIEDN